MAHTATTSNSAASWRPDINVFAPADVVEDALILRATTIAGAIEGDEPVIRAAWVSDDEAVVKAEAETLDEAEPELNEVEISTRKISQMIKLSREQHSQAGTPEQLSASVRRALVRKADELFLSDPVGGLVETVDIVDGGDVTDDLDILVDLEAMVRTNGAQPTMWVVSPTAWAELRKLKVGVDSNQSLLGAGTSDAQKLLLDVPVEVSSALAPGTGLLIDSSSIVSAIGEVQVATSTEAFFASDCVAIRATWRTGHAVVRPDRLGIFTIGSGS
ncbi:phage major capsid protein [Gordonia paraffinivorans]|uniref:phage major capsid protein n=1 Tax=Gordonia paraffinivorans TaxID=175628 RepID=UPI001445CCC7|nr:phage major capsid protein [Gordonia paraffinivorans]